MAEKRPYDDRLQKVLRALDGAAERGLVLAEVEVDGLRVRVAGLRPKDGPLASEPGVLGRAELATAAAEAGIRSYRAAAREDLRRRLRDAGEDS